MAEPDYSILGTDIPDSDVLVYTPDAAYYSGTGIGRDDGEDYDVVAEINGIEYDAAYEYVSVQEN